MNNPKGQPIFIDESPLSSEILTLEKLQEAFIIAANRSGKTSKGTFTVISTPTKGAYSFHDALYNGYIKMNTREQTRRAALRATMKEDPEKYLLAEALYGDKV